MRQLDSDSLEIRALSLVDSSAVLGVLQAAAGTLGRLAEEMDLPWADEALASALNDGVALGAWSGARLVGVIKASRMPSIQFSHVLWDLTVAVSPDCQGRGIARALFEKLFEVAAGMTPRIERIELVVRSDVAHAIRLYEQLGFEVEGRFVGRFRLANGIVEDDIPMAKIL